MCNELAAPENGYLIGSEFWEGKSVTYKCNDGYGLQGPTVRACNESGVWTGEEPTCEPKHGELYFSRLFSHRENAPVLKVSTVIIFIMLSCIISLFFWLLI